MRIKTVIQKCFEENVNEKLKTTLLDEDGMDFDDESTVEESELQNQCNFIKSDEAMDVQECSIEQGMISGKMNVQDKERAGERDVEEMDKDQENGNAVQAKSTDCSLTGKSSISSLLPQTTSRL